MITDTLRLGGIATVAGEEWRRIGETSAWVSNTGRVVRVWEAGEKRRCLEMQHGLVYELKGALAGGKKRKFYKFVTDYEREAIFLGKRYFTSIHRLVARAFIPNPEGKLEVHHVDNNPLNNNVDNLQWVTHAENMAYSKGNHPCKWVKFGDERKLEALRMRAGGSSHKEIAAMSGVSEGIVAKYLASQGLGCYKRTGPRGAIVTVERLPNRFRKLRGFSAILHP